MLLFLSTSRVPGTSRISKLNWFLLWLALLGATSTFVTPASANSRDHTLGGRQPALSEHPRWHTRGTLRRSLKQLSATPAPAPAPAISNVFIILAEGRTARRDPLNHFNKYRDGWDIRSKHYWASVGFTAAPGFIIAAIWLILGALLVLLSCCCCCCCRHRLSGSHQGGTWLPLVFLLLFTCAAVAGCALLYVGQGKLRNELSNTLDYVVGQSETVSTKLENFTVVLKDTQNLQFASFSLPANDKQSIQSLSTKLESSATTLQNKTNDNAHKIRRGLYEIRLVIIVVAAVMLLLVLLGLFLTILGVTPLVYLLVFIGWFLVAATWILCGVYILLNNVMGDSCIAMDDWVNNPSAKSNMDDILPCVDVSTANQTLQEVARVTNETTNGINSYITQVNSISTTKVPPLCNPVQASLSPADCKNLTDAPKAWRPLVCGDTVNLTCQFTRSTFDQLSATANTINNLYVQTPFLLNLADCDFVRSTFTTIKEDNCPGLRKYTKWEYIGLALVSGGAMFSLVFWILYSRRRRHKHGHPVQNEPKPL